MQLERCVFNDIVEGKLPSYKVFENEDFLAFLDIFPRSKGHTLVIPKVHYRWVYEVPNFGAYWETAHMVTRAIQKSMQPKWINYFTHGAVPYAHIHILPRYEDMSMEQEVAPSTIAIPKDEFPRIAEAIAKGF